MKLCNAYRLWLQKQHQQGSNKSIISTRGLVLQIQKEMLKSKGPSCWICLEAGPNESGQPLRRDCACRGISAGFAHLSCIITYAEHKNHCPAWYECPNCLQAYQNELAVDLASELVAFVKKELSYDQEMYLEALHLKVLALVDAKNEAEKATNEIISITNEIFSIIGRMRSMNSPLPKSIYEIEASTYNNLGRLALQQGTRDWFKVAADYYERVRDLTKALGNLESVTYAQADLEYAKYKSGEDICIDKLLGLRRWCYEFRVMNYGEGKEKTIRDGLSLAHLLHDAHKGINAERLATKLSITSERVFGPNHNRTQESRAFLQFVKERKVTMYIGDGLQCYQALHYEEDGRKCVVQGPIPTPRNVKMETIFTVASKDMIPALGTPVVCNGMESLPHLNGKIGDLLSWDTETDCYVVRFDDKDLEPPCTVKRGNVRILFEMPDV